MVRVTARERGYGRGLQQVPEALKVYVWRSTPSGRGEQASQATRDQKRRTARGMLSGGASSKRLRRSAGGQSVLAASASRSVPSAYLPPCRYDGYACNQQVIMQAGSKGTRAGFQVLASNKGEL